MARIEEIGKTNSTGSVSLTATRRIAYADIREDYQRALAVRNGVSAKNLPFYHKWLGDYLDGCHARRLNPLNGETARTFLEQMRGAGRMDFQVRQAESAVEILRGLFRNGRIVQERRYLSRLAC